MLNSKLANISYIALNSNFIDTTLVKFGFHSALIVISNAIKVDMPANTWITVTNLGITIPANLYYTIYTVNGAQINIQILQNGDVQMYPRNANVKYNDFVIDTLPLLI